VRVFVSETKRVRDQSRVIIIIIIIWTETSQADLESNTALWFALWCVFLLVLLLHFTTCIWYRLACSGLHYQRTCACHLHSWVMHMDTVYGTPSPAYCSLLPPPPPAFHMLASV